VLPTVPGNWSPGLEGEGGMGLSGHDLVLAGSLPRAGMAPALHAGQDLACGPWALPLLAAGGLGCCPGAMSWAWSSRAVGAAPGQQGRDSAGHRAPGAREVLPLGSAASPPREAAAHVPAAGLSLPALGVTANTGKPAPR